jgi:hypothetical protein
MNLTIKLDHSLSSNISKLEIEKFFVGNNWLLPPILSIFYENYYSLEFDGNRLFEVNSKHNLIKGDDDLEVSIHKTLLFTEIVKVLDSEKEEDGYLDYFKEYWSNYLPVIAPLGSSGYFLVGIKNFNLDKILFLSYNDDTIIEVCDDIFELFNDHFLEY